MYQPPYYPYWSIPQDPKTAIRKQIRKESNRSSWIVFMIFLTINMLFSISQTVMMFTNVEQTEIIEQLLNALLYGAGCFVPVLFSLMLLKSTWDINELLPFEKCRFGMAVWLFILGLAVCELSNLPANFLASLLESFGIRGYLPEEPLPTTILGKGLYAFYVAVIPAIFEEVVFRGVILSRLRKFGNGFAVVGSALLFALFHGNISQFVFAFLVGLFFGFVVVKTRNLFLVILLHFVNNGITVIFSFLLEVVEAEILNHVSSIYLIVFAVLGVGALIKLIISHRELFRIGPAVCPIGFGAKLWLLFSNPGMIFVILYFVYSAVTLMFFNFGNIIG